MVKLTTVYRNDTICDTKSTSSENRATIKDITKTDYKNWQKNKNVIFTFIFNGYDSFKNPIAVSSGWDYLCMSDCNLGSKIWKPVDITEKLKHIKCPKRKASFLKIAHYEFISSEYDICMTLDGSMLLNTDLNEFMKENWGEGTDLLIARHPKRNCIYDEAIAVLKYQLDTVKNVIPHMERYMREGFPRHQGLYGTRMMIKNNKSKNLRRVCEIWAKEYLNGSRRDQLSLNYAIWKAKKEGVEIKIKELDFNQLYCQSGKFIITRHKKTMICQ